VGSLEDPDEDRPVHIREKKKGCIIPMPRRENAILKFVSSIETQPFEKVVCA